MRERLRIGARPAGSSGRGGARRRPGDPTHVQPPAPRSAGRARCDGRPRSCQLLELAGNFPGTRRRRPHLAEHLQVVLVLVQVQHVGLQRGGRAAAAREGAAVPRALPAGAPRREARGALRRCPALALHPESARPQAAAASPAPRRAPIGSRAAAPPRRPRSSPSPGAQTRNCRAGPSAGPGLVPTWPGARGTRRIGPRRLPLAGGRGAQRQREGVPAAAWRGAAERGFPRGRGLATRAGADRPLQRILGGAGRQPTHPAKRKSQ